MEYRTFVFNNTENLQKNIMKVFPFKKKKEKVKLTNISHVIHIVIHEHPY